MSYIESSLTAYCHLCANPKPYIQLINLQNDRAKKATVMHKLSRLGLTVPHLESNDNLLPKTVCSLCLNTLDKAFQFVVDVEDAQEALNVQVLIEITKQDLLDSETVHHNGLSTVEEEIIANSMISIQESASSEVSDPDDNTPIANLKATQEDQLNSTNIVTIDLSDEEMDGDHNTLLDEDSAHSAAEALVQNKETSSTIEQFHTKVNQHLNRTTEGEDENLGTNIFSNDFEVTIVGYRMEIKSKSNSNNKKICMNDYSEIMNGDSVQCNTSHKNTEYLAIDENRHQETEIDKQTVNAPAIHHNQIPTSFDEEIDNRYVDLGQNQINLESIMAIEEEESDPSEDEFHDPKLLQNAIVTINRVDVDINETVILTKETKESEEERPESEVEKIESEVEKIESEVENIESDTEDTELVPLESWSEYTWNCGLCAKIFPSFDELTEHSKEGHRWCNTYQCGYCKFMCCNIISFIRHIEDHDKNLKLSCFKCYAKFKDPSDADYHYKQYLNDNTCAGCYKIFQNESELRDHVNSFSRGMQLNPILGDVLNKFNCTDCSVRFQTNTLLNNHIFNFHLNYIPDYNCMLCDTLFYTESKLLNHMATQHRSRRYICILCSNQNFSTVKELKEHLVIHNGVNQMFCDYCGTAFNNRKHIIRHIRDHYIKSPFPCRLCHRLFRTHDQLEQHMRIHYYKTVYTCPHCHQKMFKCRPSFRSHLWKYHRNSSCS